MLATGAIERPLVFPGNDRPGIMLAGAARSYLHRYGVRAGTRAVVVTTTTAPTARRSSSRRGGVAIAAIVDLRARTPGAAADAARDAGIEVLAGARPCAARGGGLRRVIQRSTIDGARRRSPATSC